MENSNLESDTTIQKELWTKILEGREDKSSIAINYLTGLITFDYFENNPSVFSEDQVKKNCLSVIKSLEATSIPEIRRLLAYSNHLKKVLSSNIPQFSNFASAVICVPDCLIEEGTLLSYKELGYLLFKESKSDNAAIKYGENHGKLATLLDLAILTRKNGSNAFKASILTEVFYHLELKEKMELISRLCYRIPIIQHAVIAEDPGKEVDDLLRQELSESTYNRRRPNILEILAFALGE